MSSHATRHQVPARPAPPLPARRSGAVLLAHAQLVLSDATGDTDVGERYRLAHLAALRFAAALFAERARPAGRLGRGPVSAWSLLTELSPDLADWAAYFAAGAGSRAALEAGALGVVSAREADDLVRAVEQFGDIVAQRLGLLSAAAAS